MKINLTAVFAGLFAGGMGLGAWGWDKYESTIEARTHGSVAMIVIGCVMIVVGLIGIFSGSNNKG